MTSDPKVASSASPDGLESETHAGSTLDQQESSPGLERTLRDATLDGVRWLAYGRVAYEVSAFAALAVLAHLIPPAEYGRVAIALILQSLAIGLTNEGFGNPLVQRKNVNQAHLESAALMSVSFGLLLFALVFVTSRYVITPLYGSQTTHLVRLASVMFPIYSLAVVPEAILMRKLDFRRVTIADNASAVVGFALSIGLALLGLGGSAIVIGYTVAAGFNVLILLTWVRMPKLKWHRREAREVTRYGAPASMAGLAYLSVQNVDNVLVGARLGAASLGLYYRAFALGVNNQLKIGSILMKVAFPSLSRSADQAQMQRMRDRMTRLNATVIVPLLAILAVTAPRLIPFVLGPHWKLAAVPTQILAIAGVATCLTYCAYPFLLASGHPRSVLSLNIAQFFVYGAGILITLPYGLHAVCVSVVVTNSIMMLAVYIVMARLTNLPLRRLWHDSAPAVTCSAGMTVSTIPLMHALSHSDLPTVVVLGIVGAAAAVIYSVALRTFFRPTFDDVLMVLCRVLGKEKASGASSLPEPTPA